MGVIQNQHVPVRTKDNNGKASYCIFFIIREPWMTKEIENCVKKENKACARFSKIKKSSNNGLGHSD